MLDVIYNIDFAILDFIRENFTCVPLDFLMPKISFLGNAGLIWIAAAFVLLAMKKYRKNGAMLAIGLFCCLIIVNVILKNAVGRARPCWINDTIELLIATPPDFSFPSGHTVSSFAAAEIIRRTKWQWGVCAYATAVSIAFSRLYLYVHFPSDVLIGAVIGFVVGTLVCLICRNRLKFLEVLSDAFADEKDKQL